MLRVKVHDHKPYVMLEVLLDATRKAYSDRYATVLFEEYDSLILSTPGRNGDKLASNMAEARKALHLFMLM